MTTSNKPGVFDGFFNGFGTFCILLIVVVVVASYVDLKGKESTVKVTNLAEITAEQNYTAYMTSMRSDETFNEFVVGMAENCSPEQAAKLGFEPEQLKTEIVSSCYYYRKDITNVMMLPLARIAYEKSLAEGQDPYAPVSNDSTTRQFMFDNADAVCAVMRKVFRRAGLGYCTPAQLREMYSAIEA